MDFNRIGKLINQTKDKLIIATGEDLLVVMDLDSYEDLIRANQIKAKCVGKDELDIKESITKINIKEELADLSLNSADLPIPSPANNKTIGPVAVKDVIADKAEHTFSAPAENSLAASSNSEHTHQVDEEDEFYFEEIED